MFVSDRNTCIGVCIIEREREISVGMYGSVSKMGYSSWYRPVGEIFIVTCLLDCDLP